MVEITEGNIFDAKVEALVNPVNTLGISGKGLALEFRKMFPENYKAYERMGYNGKLQPGRVFVFDYKLRKGGFPRYILNLPTKDHWRDPSRLEWIEQGVESLVWSVEKFKISSIAIPALGCGLGELRWELVYPLIEKSFSNVPGILVKAFPPLNQKSEVVEW